jgi:hypothetical protein
MALAAACVCASRKVALWVHATAHPLLLRRTPFPSKPLVFFGFLIFSIFLKNFLFFQGAHISEYPLILIN